MVAAADLPEPDDCSEESLSSGSHPFSVSKDHILPDPFSANWSGRASPVSNAGLAHASSLVEGASRRNPHMGTFSPPPTRKTDSTAIPGGSLRLGEQRSNELPLLVPSVPARVMQAFSGGDSEASHASIGLQPTRSAKVRAKTTSFSPDISHRVRRGSAPGSESVRSAGRLSFTTFKDQSGRGGSVRVTISIKAEDLQKSKRLGRGNFGVVDKCFFKPQKRMVAVKRLRPDLVKKKDDVDGLKSEIALLRKLYNSHIIEYIGYGSMDTSSEEEANKTLFLVQEFVDGGTLKGLLVKQMMAGVTLLYRTQDAVRWLTEIAMGLQYLHSRQPMVIHRDLKLENVLLKGTDPATLTPKIADFGLSALVSRNIQEAVGDGHVPDPEEPQAPRGNDHSGVFSLDDFPASPGAAPNEQLSARESRFSADVSLRAIELDGQPRLSGAAAGAGSGKHPVVKALTTTWEDNARMRRFSSRPPAPQPAEAVAPSPAPTGDGDVGDSDDSEDLKDLKVAAPGQRLSGRIGTLMYMAPEVYLKLPYDDKADVFSFGIMAYEVLHRYQMVSATDGSLQECQAYAHRVAHSGFRPPIDKDLPKPLADLIRRCWEHDPAKRPNMDQVVDELRDLQASINWARAEKLYHPFFKSKQGCCCVS